MAENRISVKDQVPGSLIVGKRLSELLNDPFGGRVRGHIEVEDLPARMVDHKPDIEYTKRCGRDCEEIHCRNALGVQLEKRPPFLELVVRGFPLRQVPGYGSFGNR